MSPENQAVFFNAVPLLALAAAYLVVTLALASALWRARERVTLVELAVASMFPSIGLAAAIYGAVVLYEREPIGGHVWPPFAATLIAFLPALLFFSRWSDRAAVILGALRAREAEARVSARDRELESMALVSNALARTDDAESAGRVLLDEVCSLFGLGFTALALVDEERGEATGLVARGEGADLDWWPAMRLDLRNETSGIASAVFEAAPVSVYDVETSAIVSRRLAEHVGAKSAVFVPLVTHDDVIGVLVAATTDSRHAFSPDELTLMQTLAAEAALSLERIRSARALEDALERERLVAGIARRVRSELDTQAVMKVAVEETGRALGVARCFIRLGGADGPAPIGAEWHESGLPPIETSAERLAGSNLAVRERRTVAIGDVRSAPELEDPTLGGRETLLALGTRAVVACPLIVFDRVIGVLAAHRSSAEVWPAADVSFAEAVAREVALAIHTAGLLGENEQRLAQRTALFEAAQAVTSELRLETVLQRLVDQVSLLLEGDAADCYFYDGERGTLRCAAVHGLEPGLVGFEFSAGRGLAGHAIAEGRPVLSEDYAALDAVPHSAYRGFEGAIVAPMIWSEQIVGVLGVGTRDASRSFTETEADLLGAFASLASLALRNAETFEERLRQAQIQRGFFRIATVLSEPLSLEKTLEAVAQAATDALGGVFAAVLTPAGDELTLTGAYELPPELEQFLGRGLRGDAGPLRECARSRRILSAPAVAEDARFDEDWRQVARASGFASLLAVPVEGPTPTEGGLVVVFFADQRRFTDDDLELARHLAGATRGALERSRLFEAERSSRALSQQLARTGSLLATELDPAAVLDEVVEQAPALLGADACSIQRLEGEELVLSAARGEGAEDELGVRAPATAWLAGDVVQSREPVAVADASDERLVQADPVLAGGYVGYLGVPLIGSEGNLHGVLAVYARRPRIWRDEEVAALVALAVTASAALSNAELYQRVALEKERSLAILENIADGIVAVDREGCVVLWNTAASEITGVAADEAFGRTTAQVLQRNLESDGGGRPGNRLLSIRRGADEVWLSVTEAIMRDPAGAVAGRIFAFRDISAERVVEQMKSDFVSTVSQRLRTPLTSIYGFAETLLRRDILFGEEERATFLGYIASESARLTEIVDALLNVARLDTGDLHVQLTPTDVRPVVSEVVSSLEHAVPLNGHKFVVDLPAEPLDAEADRDKLRQILVNLVENAVKYSPEGGTVTIAARQRRDAVEIRVDDEGMGIPHAEQERIFSKFYRAEAAAREGGGGGTGLGLFIAQGLVAAMGGRIWVTSAEGEGSSFVFELPLARSPALSTQE